MARITPVTSWTRNAVSVAEPSVCHQLVSPGTLRKRKYLTPPTSPERSSSQSSGYIAAPTTLSRRSDFLRAISDQSDEIGALPGCEKQAREGRRERSYLEGTGATEDAAWRRLSRAGGRPMSSGWSPLVGRLQRVEPGLGAVRVLAGAVQVDLLDLGGLAGALDLDDAVEVAEHQAPFDDVELVAVEAANRRAGDAVALLVVRAAVARTDEAGRRQHRCDQHLAVVAPDRLLLLREDRAARLHRATDVRAAVRDDREARNAVEQAVVAHEGGAARDLAVRRVTDEGDDLPLVLLEI